MWRRDTVVQNFQKDNPYQEGEVPDKVEATLVKNKKLQRTFTSDLGSMD